MCFAPAGLALASGLAATVTITHMLKAGDGIVCMDDVYGGEMHLASRLFKSGNQVSFCHVMHTFTLHRNGWRKGESIVIVLTHK